MVRQQIAEVDRRRAANNCVYHGLYNNDKNNMIRYSHFYQNLYMLRSRLRGDGRRYFFWKISAKIRINKPSDQRTFGTMNLRNKKPSEQRHGTSFNYCDFPQYRKVSFAPRVISFLMSLIFFSKIQFYHFFQVKTEIDSYDCESFL